jgi:hypothetical protein
MTCEEQADAALRKLKALQNLTLTTGTITSRAQRELLRSLPPDVMILVADQLYSSKNPILKTTPETDSANFNRYLLRNRGTAHVALLNYSNSAGQESSLPRGWSNQSQPRRVTDHDLGAAVPDR